jgi:hypothetical protein
MDTAAGKNDGRSGIGDPFGGCLQIVIRWSGSIKRPSSEIADAGCSGDGRGRT